MVVMLSVLEVKIWSPSNYTLKNFKTETIPVHKFLKMLSFFWYYCYLKKADCVNLVYLKYMVFYEGQKQLR